MTPFLNAFAFALVLTALYWMRFGEGARGSTLAAYFALFFSIEWIAASYLFPADAMGLEVAATCFALTIPVVGATLLIRRVGRASEE